MRRILAGLTIALLLLTVTGCGAGSGQAPKTEILVSAAASLTDAFQEIAKEFSKDNPQISVKFNFGGSGALQAQIEQGAPVDLFASASTKQTDYLQSKNLIEKPRNFARNTLVLITPKDNPAGLKGFQDIANPSLTKLALGNPASVPAGQYGMEVLKYLNLSERVKPKLINGSDVRKVLQWVESGNAGAGIVYKSDALTGKGIMIVAEAPKGSHKEILYPAALVKASNKQEAAGKFLDFLFSSQAKEILAKYGLGSV